MDSSVIRRRRTGSAMVAASYTLSGLAAYAIFSTHPGLSTREGRHLFAGALAILSLAIVEALIALIPLRRGERWAFWAAVAPLLVLVIPVMLIDAANVARAHMTATLAPFIAGLLLAVGGLWLAR